MVSRRGARGNGRDGWSSRRGRAGGVCDGIGNGAASRDTLARVEESVAGLALSRRGPAVRQGGPVCAVSARRSADLRARGAPHLHQRSGSHPPRSVGAPHRARAGHHERSADSRSSLGAHPAPTLHDDPTAAYTATTGLPAHPDQSQTRLAKSRRYRVHVAADPLSPHQRLKIALEQTHYAEARPGRRGCPPDPDGITRHSTRRATRVLVTGFPSAGRFANQ